MKRRVWIRIILIAIVILLIATFLYKVYQVKSFQKDLRPPTEKEKQEITNILNNNTKTAGYQICFGNVFTEGKQELIQVQLKGGNIKRSCTINLENKTIIRK
jgi:hypothetical protein